MRHSRQRRGVALRRMSFLAPAPSGSRMGRDEFRWGTPPGLCLEHVSRLECLVTSVSAARLRGTVYSTVSKPYGTVRALSAVSKLAIQTAVLYR